MHIYNTGSEKLELHKQILERKVEEQTYEIIRKNTELVSLNSEKDKFFSIIAYDLRGPFCGLMMLTNQMAEGIHDLNKEEISESLKVIQYSSNKLFGLLENLLRWARIKQGKIPFNPGNIELSSFITDSLTLLMLQADMKKLEITMNFSPWTNYLC